MKCCFDIHQAFVIYLLCSLLCVWQYADGIIVLSFQFFWGHCFIFWSSFCCCILDSSLFKVSMYISSYLCSCIKLQTLCSVVYFDLCYLVIESCLLFFSRFREEDSFCFRLWKSIAWVDDWRKGVLYILLSVGSFLHPSQFALGIFSGILKKKFCRKCDFISNVVVVLRVYHLTV